MLIPIVGQAYTEFSLVLDAQTCKNWYLVQDKEGKFPTALYPTPGLTLFSSGSGSQVRGLFETNGICYAVIDSIFYQINSDGTRTSKGTLVTTTGRCRFISNSSVGITNQIMISDGNNGYVYNIATGSFSLLSQNGVNSVTIQSSGTNYSQGDTATINDQTGTGATVTLTIASGAISAVTVVNQGSGYTNPTITINTSTGSGFVGQVFAGQFLGCDTLTYKDGFAVFNVPNKNLFQISGAGDFTSYNSTFSASLTDAGEPIVAVAQYKDEVWLFNSRHAEVWFNNGGTNLPFAKRESFLITQGLAAKDSLVSANNTLIWYSRSSDGKGFITEWNFYTPNNISTHAVDYIINTYPITDDAFAYAYRMDGNLFYVITFPTANATWVYNFATQSWHQWSSSGLKNIQNRHLSNCFAYCYNKNLVGDYQSGNIYYLDNTNYTDNGTNIIRERTCKHLYKDNMLISAYNFVIELEAGIGLQNGQGSNPQIMLQISKDGGRTWGPELWQSAGKIGQYTYRALWPSLGMARDWVFRIRTSDPNKFVILGARCDVEEGDN